MLVLVWPLQNLVFALGAPLALVVVVALANGFGFSLLMVWWETALAYHIPPNALGRVSAYDWMGSLALVPVGFLVAGPLANAFGAREVLGVGAVLGVLMLLLLAAAARRPASSPAPPARASCPVPQPSSSRAISA